jgi:hypothetical protein
MSDGGFLQVVIDFAPGVEFERVLLRGVFPDRADVRALLGEPAEGVTRNVARVPCGTAVDVSMFRVVSRTRKEGTGHAR